MKTRWFAQGIAGLLLLIISGTAAADTPYDPKSGELFRTLAEKDAQVFEAYNTCNLEKFATFFTADLEFYHDQTGLSRGLETAKQALRNNICGKVRRDLVPGTLEAYPLKGFGAVQMGVHRFCAATERACGAGSGLAKFVHLWQNTSGEWKIVRVISYDHCSRCETKAAAPPQR